MYNTFWIPAQLQIYSIVGESAVKLPCCEECETGYRASVYMAPTSILEFRVKCKTSQSITCPNFGRIGDRRDIECRSEFRFERQSRPRPHERMTTNLPPSRTTSRTKLQNPTIHCLSNHIHRGVEFFCNPPPLRISLISEESAFEDSLLRKTVYRASVYVKDTKEHFRV